MGRNTSLLIALCAMLLAGSAPLLAHAADTKQADAAPRWSAADIAQHIDALDHITPPQAGAQELVRILSAIMSQPDTMTRLSLFNRLRPHIVPYQAPTPEASLRVKASSSEQQTSP